MLIINSVSKIANEAKWYIKVSFVLKNLDGILIVIGRAKIQPIIKKKMFSFKYKKVRASMIALFARPSSANKYFTACLKLDALNMIQPIITNSKVMK